MKLFTKVTLGLCLFLFSLLSLAYGQANMRIQGKVLDAATHEGIAGATVSVIGAEAKASTDVQGQFVLTDVPANARLRVSYLGYNSTEVIAKAGEMIINLSSATNALEDVVVIGYGSVKRKDVTTAISSVSLDDLNERPIVNAAQAMQGRAAGVTVMQPSGSPGGGTAIRIRGTTSFNGSNDPLYVVDGIPVDNINFLAPSDITDMQVLKDASSAAIYGSRAANGVVLITTKQGMAGNAKVTFNMLATQNRVTNSIEPLNTAQYIDLQKEIGLVELPDNLTDQTNWFDETFRNGVTQSYQASVSDGTEKLKYYLSGGYMNEKGVINTAFFKRYNFRANIDNKVRDWLKINANISYSDNNRNGVTEGLGSNRGGVVLSTINTPTYAPIWDPFEPEHYYNNFYGINNVTSPLENMARSKNNKDRESRILAAGSATIFFLPELNFKSTFALDRRNGFNSQFLDPISTSWGRQNFGMAYDARNTNTVLTFDNVLNYNKSVGLHNFEAMLGSSWTGSKYENNYINASHFRNDLIQTLNAANKISWNGTGSGASDWAIMSYFGRLAYNFDSKYLVTANLRADGSSKLSPENRWSMFPSISAAWRLSSEEFLSDIPWLNDLKIRGGWGKTGNQSGIGDYSYLQLYNIRRIEWFQNSQDNALPVVSAGNLRTKDLKWETTTQTNVGVDFTGFNQRLTVNLDYYYKYTKDMLMYVSLPEGAAQASSIRRNEGEMSNRGFEVNVNSKNLVNDFKWSTTFNISFNKNRLEHLDMQQIYDAGKTVDFVNANVVRNTPGRPMGSFFGYISDGVNPETGELMYRDSNEDGVLSTSDRTFIGDPNPKFTYGMTNDLSYQGFNFSVFIQGSQGNDIFNASRMETEGMYNGMNQSTRVLQRWRVPGQHTEVPKANFDMKNSTYFVEDGSYLRLKNISISYNIKGNILSKWGVNRLQPFISATNLLTLTKYKGFDPEVNQYGNSGELQGIDWGTYPQTKSFVLGINLEF